MKYFFRLLFIVSMALGLSACNEILTPQGPDADEVPFRLTFSTADRVFQTKSMVSGTENAVHTMQLVCFDANGQYLGIRDAKVSSNGESGNFFDTGVINGTVPQGTARIHFIANRNLSIPLSFSNGTAEESVLKSLELSTAYNDADHQEICFWGYHKAASAEAMSAWLKPSQGTNNVVYMIRDRARVVLTYDPAGATVTVIKIEWLIHNGRDRGYIAPAKEFWGNDSYYENSSSATGVIVSKAGINEYKASGRYSLWTSATENEDDNFDVAYQSSDTYIKKDQFLFDDDNADVDDVKVILKVTYSGNPKPLYHVLRLNDNDQKKYDVVRNHTYYINTKLLSPDVAFYETLEDAVNGTEFVNADVEVDRSIPDINNDTYTLQIKLPNEGTSVVLNTEGTHNLDFVFRMVNDVNTTGSTDPADFDVYWEKSQTFCTDPTLTYIPALKQFQIHTTVITGQLTNQLQDEWIVVEHKVSGLKRFIHVYVIDQFRYLDNPTLKKVGNTDDYVLSFKLPPMEHSQFLEDGSPDPEELIYPESLYPIDVMFTTNTLNAYGTTQGTTNYGLFGVSVEGTEKLCHAINFESGHNSPISSTDYDNDRTYWYFQQANNYWDFWYTYSLKTYPEGGVVNIYFKDVRDHIKYATVTDVGLFLYVEFFGKNYSVPVTTD